jgi:hypothetical protein
MQKISSTLASLALAFCASTTGYVDSDKTHKHPDLQDVKLTENSDAMFQNHRKGVPFPVPQGQNKIKNWHDAFNYLRDMYEAFVPPCSQVPQDKPDDPNPS